MTFRKSSLICWVFLSTPSARRATMPTPSGISSTDYFYPRPPRGGRHLYTRPVRLSFSYFYPRPPRGGRQFTVLSVLTTVHISIHALREEGDCASFSSSGFSILFLSTPSARRATRCFFVFAQSFVISIHALREEGDLSIMGSGQGAKKFLSTPSARRATNTGLAVGLFTDISIHALREEGDDLLQGMIGTVNRFLSTPSARRATFFPKRVASSSTISIHALREEGDPMRLDFHAKTYYFYPRPPRGGRPIGYILIHLL